GSRCACVHAGAPRTGCRLACRMTIGSPAIRAANGHIHPAMNRTLINCSNLHVGGGVQVATSVVSELRREGVGDPAQAVSISTEVADNLGDIGDEGRARPDIFIMNMFGLRQDKAVRRFMDRHAAVLTLFGPL